MNLDFKEIAKQNFKCIQMGDGSIYYGELEWLDPETNEIVFNYDDMADG